MIKISGGNSEGDPPVPIPNTEVKPFSADNTRLETSWEDKTLPDPNIQRQDEKKSCLCFMIRRKKSREGVNRNRYASVWPIWHEPLEAFQGLMLVVGIYS